MEDVLAFFDARLTEWSVVPECSADDATRFTAFHNLPRLQRLKLFRNKVVQDALLPTYLSALRTPNESYIVSRIGSPSKYGEVYLVCMRGVYLACKVLPILSPESQAQNVKELQFAQKASDLVERGVCPYFPLVYFASPASKVVLQHSNSLVALRGRLWEARPRVLDMLIDPARTEVPKGAKTILFRKYKEQILSDSTDIDVAKPKEQWLADLGKVFQIEQLRIPPAVFSAVVDEALAATPEFTATLLFSELADVDLKYMFLADKRSQLPPRLDVCKERFMDAAVFRQVCLNIVQAIQALQNVSMVHNDLHMANVLVMCHGAAVIPLLHDFGLSRVQREWDTGSRIHDLYSLFIMSMQDSDLVGQTGLSPEAEDVLRGIKEIVNTYARQDRTDTGLFDELISFLTAGLTGGRRAAPRALNGGYASAAFGMIKV